MKKHIVFALGDYYPTPSANGICVDKIIESFIKAGYYVDVVANCTDGNKTVIKEKDLTIHFVELPLIDIVSERINKENNRFIKRLLYIARKTLAVRLPLLLITYPICSLPRCIKYKKVIDTIIKNNRVVSIVGVHKPIEAMYGAYVAAQKSGIPFFGYFLDPLVEGYRNKLIGDCRIGKKTECYENRIVKGSNKTIFMNSHHEAVINRYKGILTEKIVFLGPPLLTEKETNKKIKKRKEKKHIVYAGSLYKDIRNPKYIMEVFKRVKNARLEMYIPNPEEWIYLHINENISIHRGISHKNIVSKLESADALLNIGNSNPIFIPSKLIEYISMKKPIVSTYRIDSDPCLPYLDKYPDSLMLDERCDSIEDAAEKIDHFIMQTREGISFEELKKAFYINTPEAFIKVIESGIEDCITEID